jgi:hypothetical protein
MGNFLVWVVRNAILRGYITPYEYFEAPQTIKGALRSTQTQIMFLAKRQIARVVAANRDYLCFTSTVKWKRQYSRRAKFSPANFSPIHQQHTQSHNNTLSDCTNTSPEWEEYYTQYPSVFLRACYCLVGFFSCVVAWKQVCFVGGLLVVVCVFMWSVCKVMMLGKCYRVGIVCCGCIVGCLVMLLGWDRCVFWGCIERCIWW